MHPKKWEPISRKAKLSVLGFVMVMLLLGSLVKNRDSHSELFEGIMEWNSIGTNFYPDGKCFVTRYEYLGSQNPSADLNRRRQQKGSPHALGKVSRKTKRCWFRWPFRWLIHSSTAIHGNH